MTEYNYTFGQAGIDEHNYDIYLRIHGTHSASQKSNWKDGISDIVNFAEAVSVPTASETAVDFDEDALCPFIKIGHASEKPTMKENSGNGVPVNNGSEIKTSKESEVNFEDLNVTIVNTATLRDVLNGFEVDILYVETDKIGNGTAGAAIGFAMSKMNLEPLLNIEGNGYNKMVVSGKRKSGTTDDVIVPIKVYNPA